MASTNLQMGIVMRVIDEASAGVKSVESSLSKMKGTFDEVGKTSAIVGTAITGALGLAVKAFADGEVVQARFETVLKNVSKATEGQIQALRDQQNALSQTTRFEDDAIASGQAFLGTFALTATQIQTLTPRLLDMAEGLRKASGGTIDLEGASNMLGKAIASGSLSALAKAGVTIPGVTKAEQELFMKSFELADQQKRVAMTAQLMDGNFRGLAEAGGKTLAGQMDILKNNFGNIMETVGQQLVPALTQLLQAVTPIIAKMGEWMAQNPVLTQDIVMVAAVLGPLLIILPGLVAAIAAIASTAGIVIIAIGLLVAAGVLLYRHWDQVKAFAISVWDSIVAYFNGVKDKITAMLNSIKDFFTSTWNGIKDAFTFAVNLLVGILDLFLRQFDANWVQHLKQALAFFKDVWDQAKSILSAFGDWVMTNIKALLSWLLTNIATWTEPLTGAFSSIWNSVKGVTSEIWEGIKGVVSGAVNWIIDKVNAVIDTINSVAAAGAKITGMSAPKINNIPKLASGGIVTSPTLALIGEAGPEAVVPLSSAGRGAAAGLGGGATVNITIGNFWGGDPERAAREIGDLIIKRLQLNARVA